MNFKEKLNEDLTQMFAVYQHRLENPMPINVEGLDGGWIRYQTDGMFRGIVKNLVAGTMQTVMKHVEDADNNTGQESAPTATDKVDKAFDIYNEALKKRDEAEAEEKKAWSDYIKAREHYNNPK
jgi:hypothetical protein